MLKLFGSMAFRIMIYTILLLAAIWFYFVFQEPTFLTQVLFGSVFASLIVSVTIEVKLALDRFINTPSK